MNPTEILSDEHRVIEQVLQCLARIAQQAESQRKLDGEAAEKAVVFFRHFADECHHGKEEAHLFPAMEAKGFPRACGPTGVMIAEHELGRCHVRAMKENIGPAAQGDRAALEAFVEHARAYGDLLSNHIQKEDHCLFPMADQAFTEEDQRKLLLAFQRVETEEIGAGVHEKYLALADELADRFGVPRASAAHGVHSCGRCCH
ncbi:MAG TPA: hemerythrin domain-containing protein [Thermoguttaceae bacterium]|nr:hemerythrin domain-containing protein [Thermoguttaceae bacterium]